MLLDRDAIYGTNFAAMTRDMEIEEVLTAPRSPWQNPFVERLVGSIRRECLDHVIVWNERSLRRTLHNYLVYYQRSRYTFAKRTPCTWRYSPWGGRDCQSSECNCQRGGQFIDEICDQRATRMCVESHGHNSR